MRFRSGRQDLVAYDPTADGTWNPCIEEKPSVGFRLTRARVWVAGLDGVQVSWGYQFSKDGIDWDAPVRVGSFTTPTNDAWNFPAWGEKDLFDSGDGVTKQLFVRFGLFAKPTTAGQVRPFQADLEIEADPVVSGTVVTEWALIYGKSSSVAREFQLTGPLPLAEQVNEVRISTEIEAASGESADTLNVQAVTFEGNEPMVPTDWAIGDAIGSYVTATTYGTTFTGVTPDKRYMKFGVRARSSSGNLVAGRIRLRIEFRT